MTEILVGFGIVDVEPGEEREIGLTAVKALRASYIQFCSDALGNLSVARDVAFGSRVLSIAPTPPDATGARPRFEFRTPRPPTLHKGERLVVRFKNMSAARLRVFAVLCGSESSGS